MSVRTLDGADLKGKRVSLDEPGSGTLVDAQLIMAAAGLSEADITPEYLKPDQAADRMKDGAMDAFFFVGGYPAGAIAELASQHEVTVVPITDPIPPDDLTALTVEGLTLIAKSVVRPMIGQTVPLERAADAHAAIEARSVLGKTVLRV